MGILLFALFGLLVGFIARALVPGRQAMGIGMTAVLGMIGSLIGGLIGNSLAGRPLFEIHGAGLIGSVLCAIAILFAVGAGGRRRFV
jgi:uncharacterized membrane protein YeaQ/YmgE (transglycosylase-associated protein family)